MSRHEMATVDCLIAEAVPSSLSSCDQITITIVPDATYVAARPAVDEKDSGTLSEPEELRRSSKRTRTRRSLCFKEKTDSDQVTSDLVTDGKDPTSVSMTPEERKKQRSVWTIPETQAFFDALSEHGKDFLAIQSFIHSKLASDASKKNKSTSSSKSLASSLPPSSTTSPSTQPVLAKAAVVAAGETEAKSREQVRHYYYRMWHKISSCCRFESTAKLGVSHDGACEESPDKMQEMLKEVDKSVLELYGLINYGEIWKKFPTKWDSRIKSHLKELVLEGSTVIKCGPKAKAIKIRTPTCKALKRVNGMIMPGDSSQETTHPLSHQLPDDILVQLLPQDNETFLRVQSLAKNPRLQCRVCLQKKISSLALFLEQSKWDGDRPRKLLGNEWSDCLPEDLLMVGSRSGVRLTLHPSLLRTLDPLSTGLMISPSTGAQPLEPSLQSSNPVSHQCSSLSLSFRSYLRNSQRSKGSSLKSGAKAATRKDKTASLVSTSAAVNDACSPPSVKPLVDSLAEVEDSCSSTSSVTPFRDAVKKLASLNQALATEDIEAEETDSLAVTKASATPEPSKSVPVDDQPDCQVVSSSLSDDNEVSLPPPTATLAQWLSSRETSAEGGSAADEGKTEDFSNSTAGEQVSLDVESIRDGWTSEETSITLGELYLLLKSPPKITFTYSFYDRQTRSHGFGGRNGREQRIFESVSGADSQEKRSISLLDKLLTAASISLSLQKKMHSTSVCPPTAPVLVPSSSCASTQSSPATVAWRASVPSVGRSPATVTKKQQLVNPSASGQLEVTAAANQHNFLMPTAPAPKAAPHLAPAPGAPVHSLSDGVQGSRGGCKRQRIICDDPQALEEAIKQLNQNRFMPKKRQRVIRPITVGPVSSKILLPRQTIQVIPGSAAPAAQIQILSAPPPVAAADAAPATPASGLGLPICFSPNTVPTILIPTVIANLNAPAAAPAPTATSVETSAAAPLASTDALAGAQVSQALEVSQQDDGDLAAAPSSVPLCESATGDVRLDQNSSLPCLSSLLELSLPDSNAAPASSTPSSISHSFFNDNSCSSISEFISFGNPNLSQAAGTQASQAKEACKTAHTPNWLLSEGSNSSSLGLSSLLFNANELI